MSTHFRAYFCTALRNWDKKRGKYLPFWIHFLSPLVAAKTGKIFVKKGGEILSQFWGWNVYGHQAQCLAVTEATQWSTPGTQARNLNAQAVTINCGTRIQLEVSRDSCLIRTWTFATNLKKLSARTRLAQMDTTWRKMQLSSLSAQFWSSCRGISVVRSTTRETGDQRSKFKPGLGQAVVTWLPDRCPRNAYTPRY